MLPRPLPAALFRSPKARPWLRGGGAKPKLVSSECAWPDAAAAANKLRRRRSARRAISPCPAPAWPCPVRVGCCISPACWRSPGVGGSVRFPGRGRCVVSGSRVVVPFRAWWVPGRAVRRCWASQGVQLPRRVPVWAVFRAPGPGPRSWCVVFPSGSVQCVIGSSVSAPGGSGARSVAAWRQQWARFGGRLGLLASWPWPGGHPRWLPVPAGS